MTVKNFPNDPRKVKKICFSWLALFFCFEPEKVTDYADFKLLTIAKRMQVLHYISTFKNMLKNIAKLTIFKKKKSMCISAEWRVTSQYLDTSQKATAIQQCHLVALTCCILRLICLLFTHYAIFYCNYCLSNMYWRANQEWQWRNILFTISW